MANLISLNFQNDSIRTYVQDEAYYFCLADICKILNLKNPTHTANQIKQEFSCPTLNVGQVEDPSGRKTATFITEPQLYYILNRSNAKNAHKFRMWVNCEVLPAIRKHGVYVKDQENLKFDSKRPWYIERLLDCCKRFNMSQAALREVINISERCWKQGYAVAMSKKEAEAEGTSSNNNGMFSDVQINNLYELAQNVKEHEKTLLRFGKDVADFGQVLIEMSHIINYVAEGSVITLSDIRHTIEKHQKEINLKKAS